jgi:uncharacterized protein
MTSRDRTETTGPAAARPQTLAPTSVVLPTPRAAGTLVPLATPPIIDGGFWGDRLLLNREVTIRHGLEQLQQAGNLHNFRLAAGTIDGTYRSTGKMFDSPFPFLDTDVYKWLEAVGWELGRGPDEGLARAADEVIALVAAAQRPDGYINTFVQVLGGGVPYRDLAWGHELYTFGHLVQAAIAWVRGVGDDRLLRIAERAVESVECELGAGGRDGTDGHPEIEMALVELYRTTGEARHLELARRLIDARGRGLLGPDRFGSAYWQDHLPVREAPTVAGHAVRQLYLDSGVVDVAVEMGDQALLDAVVKRWEDMVATRVYVTGSVGSRHKDESFGDRFELPPDRSYGETCAAIASVMLAWRLLLATGRSECADVIERTMFNAVLPGISLDGRSFFYVNSLQRREGPVPPAPGDGIRAAWYPCSCCPPNLMRTFSTWEQYLATTDDTGIQIHQYADARLSASTPGGPVQLTMSTGYPWNGRVQVRVDETPESPWSLTLRVPGWCTRGRIDVPGEPARPLAGPGPIVERRRWQAGDVVVLDLEMPARLTEPDPRIDAVRGCVAIERGPLVYCLEQTDLAPGTAIEDVEIDPSAVPVPVARPDVGPRVVGVSIAGLRREAADGWPYRVASAGNGDGGHGGHGGVGGVPPATAVPVDLGMVPYLAWANRRAGTMRVWLPRAQRQGKAPR